MAFVEEDTETSFTPENETETTSEVKETPFLVESKTKAQYPVQINPEFYAPILRGIAPTAAQAGAGIAVGTALAPFTGGVSIPLAAGGGILSGQLADLTVNLVNSNFGTHYTNTKDAVTHVLDKIGVPESRSSAQKITEAVTEGAAGMYGGAKGFGELAKVIKPEAVIPMKERFAAEATQKLSKLMAERPIEQAVVGGAASGAGEIAKESGMGAGGQLATQLGAGIATALAIASGRGALSLLPRTAAQKAQQAEQLASGAYQKMVVDKKQALDDLARSKEVSDAEVKMMTGDITGDPGLLAMQDMLERESNVLASRKAANIAGMSKKVSEGLPETGVSPEETQQYFTSAIDNIVQQTEKNKQSAIAQGETEAAKLIEDAGIKAAEIKAKAEQGVVTAQDAFEEIKNKYQDLFTDLSSLKESTVKDKLSESAFEVIKRQKDREKIYINELYDAAEKEVPKFYQKNTVDAKSGLVKEFGEERRLPTEVQKILGEVQDAKGNMKLRSLPQLRADIKAINSEIRAAQSSASRQAEVPALIKFKQALNKDIESLEGVSENLKTANRAYYEYAQRFKEGASGEAFHPKALTSKTLDQFIKKSEASASPEEIERLRNAIIGKTDIPNMTPEQTALADADRASAINNVSDWVLSKMSGEVKGTKTSQSIENWLQTKGNRIFEVFPESRKRVLDIQDQFKSLEEQVNAAKKTIQESKTKQIAEGKQAALVENQAKEASKLVENRYQEEVKKLQNKINLETNPNSNPAARFIGGNPYEVVNKIMTNKETSEKDVQRLLEQAAKDQSGNATEGLKNAFRRWLNSQSRTTSKESVGTGIAAHQANLADFQVDLKKINDLMQPDSATRNSLEIVFGKDSPELQTIDKVRQQLDMMSRTSKVKVQGFDRAEDKVKEIKDTVLELAGIGLAGVKGYIAWKSTDLVRKVQKQYDREVIELFKNMMIDSMSDPELARKLLLKVNEENLPAIQRVFATYGIKNLKASDFGITENKPKQDGESEISFEEE